MTTSAHPPLTESELIERARGLAGLSLAEVAARFGKPVPTDPRRAKGWTGALCELALGSTAASRAVPDFEALGIELKTIPVNRAGRPLETTFVCSIALPDVGDIEWSRSRACSKLRRVLWVPVLAERAIPMADRRFGSAFLWSPTPEEESALRWDWEELAGLIGRGRFEEVTGRLGKFLQVRPKAANGKSRRRVRDEDGAELLTLPRGFYLRPEFTWALLRRHLVLPGGSSSE
jgi:DNA mismatch repair protein MutH